MRVVLVLVALLAAGAAYWVSGGSRSDLPPCDAEAGVSAVKEQLARMLPKLGERGSARDIAGRMKLTEFRQTALAEERGCSAVATVTRRDGLSTYDVIFEVFRPSGERAAPGWRVMSLRAASRSESL